MGAWGTGSFENDGALDLGWEIAEGGLPVIEKVFDRVLAAKDSYLEDAEEAVAAAEVVAKLCGRGPSPYLDDLHEIEDDGLSDEELTLGSWIATAKATPSEDLIEKARRAIARVLAGPTELADLWHDSKHFEEWKLVIDDLSKRLSAGTTDNSRAGA
ncbi:MAG: DUF4259 domain-containing protein [Hyphomicrobiales bacterium]|nr:DUF4259 domain-containing protein [Hyphomicrobiales bacterium]